MDRNAQNAFKRTILYKDIIRVITPLVIRLGRIINPVARKRPESTATDSDAVGKSPFEAAYRHESALSAILEDAVLHRQSVGIDHIFVGRDDR